MDPSETEIFEDFDHRVNMEIEEGRRETEPGPKNISFQMELEDFAQAEAVRLALREPNRSSFIKEALTYYVEEFNRTGLRPGSPGARSKGDQIMDLMEILGLDGYSWTDLIGRLDTSEILGLDSVWRVVFNKIADLLEA